MFTWGDFLEAFQEVCKDKSMVKRSRPLFAPRRQLGEKNVLVRGQRENPGRTKACYTYGTTDTTHDWKTCQGKKKAINEVEFLEGE